MLGGPITRIGDRLFQPFIRLLVMWRVKPFVVNVLELATAIASGACLAAGRTGGGVAGLIVHGFFDYLDGALRRAGANRGKDGPAATLCHAAGDKASDVLLFFLMAWGGWVPWWLAAAAGAGSVVATVLGLWGHRRGIIVRRKSLFDRSDRIVVLAVLAAVSQFYLGVLASLVLSLVVIAQRALAWRDGQRFRGLAPGFDRAD